MAHGFSHSLAGIWETLSWSDLLFYSMPAQRTKITFENFIVTPRELEYNTIYRRASSCPPESRFGKVKFEGPPSFVSRYEPYDKKTHALLQKHDHNMVRITNSIENKLIRHTMANNGNNKVIRRKLDKLEHIEDRQIDLLNLNGQLSAEIGMATFNTQEIMQLMQAMVMKMNHIENGVRELRELVEEDYRSEDHPSEEEAEQDLPWYEEDDIGEQETSGSEYGLSTFDLEMYLLQSTDHSHPIPILEEPVAGPLRQPLTTISSIPIPDTLVEITEDLQPVFRVFEEEEGHKSDGSYHTPMIMSKVIDPIHLEDEDVAPPGSIGNEYIDHQDGPPRQAPSSRVQEDDDSTFQCTVPSER
jgi:hypothetical protein